MTQAPSPQNLSFSLKYKKAQQQFPQIDTPQVKSWRPQIPNICK